jgi:hypothetical protein
MRNISLRLLAALPLLSPAAALAGPVQLSNSTSVLGSDGTSYASIGADFQTIGVTISTVQQGATEALTLTYATTFDGSYQAGADPVSYADMFLRLPGAGYSAQPFTYAISLGDEAANGGIAAGLYTPGQVATSQDIWSGRSGYIYGAGYSAYAGGPAFAAPVVLRSGTEVAGVSVSSQQTDTHTQFDGQDVYDLSVTISGIDATLAARFAAGYDVFWGTADCSNGAFLASNIGTGEFLIPVSEPSSVGLATVGVGLILAARRPTRRRARRHGPAPT